MFALSLRVFLEALRSSFKCICTTLDYQLRVELNNSLDGMELRLFPGNATAWLTNTSEISENDTPSERKYGMQKKTKNFVSENSEINSFWLHCIKIASCLKDNDR